jgi:hypothetical protein
MTEKLRVFLCYAHEDKEFLEGLRRHLEPLRKSGLIEVWHDGAISAGTDWSEEIKRHLHEAHIILLLVSADFIASPYCYDVEMRQAMERHEKGEARVIPIIVRPVYWQDALFGKLQALPANAIPVTSKEWHHQDEAFMNVAEGVRQVVGGTVPPTIAEQEEFEELDPKEVWERIQRKDIPSIWHVIKASNDENTNTFIIGAIGGALMCMLPGALLGGMISDRQAGIWMAGSMLLGAVVGMYGMVLLSTKTVDMFVLMPGGFLSFSGKTPRHIISYKAVEALRFDGSKLVVTTTPRSGAPKSRRGELGGAITVSGFDETPLSIAQRVAHAYTGFQARNTPQLTSARHEEASEKLDPKAVWAKAVWERIQRKEVPSTWHVHKTPGITQVLAFGCVGGWGVLIAIIVLALGLAFFSGITGVSPSNMPDPPLWVPVGTLLFGFVLGGLEGLTYWTSTFVVLMPDGCISFDERGTPRHIISYKAVATLRFDCTKKILTVITTPLCHELDLGKLDEDPHLIAQHVEDAYMSFKARNNLP